MTLPEEQALTTAVNALESRFAVRGVVKLQPGKSATVRVFPEGIDSSDEKPSPPKEVQFSMSLEHVETNKALEPILLTAVPSPFGHGAETKLDESVRKASELRPDKFAWADFDPNDCAGLLEEIRKSLVPDARAISATLHKLNVYGAGGRGRTRVYHIVTCSSTQSSFLMYLLSDQTCSPVDRQKFATVMKHVKDLTGFTRQARIKPIAKGRSSCAHTTSLSYTRSRKVSPSRKFSTRYSTCCGNF
jgi:hypothetical protein